MPRGWWQDALLNSTLLAAQNVTGTTRDITKPPSPYVYQPTEWLAVVAATMFALATFIHTWVFCYCRSWLLWAMLIGAFRRHFFFVPIMKLFAYPLSSRSGWLCVASYVGPGSR